ncbi:unnamed protein product [Albugo candida]|uniref:Uncharacterized protein n=1 Tax=Albugo candida TaxID=65357 RepID=A0A024GM71_9STRA|nr:unnamed protein product [Albugo candida]|eukprot:CCI47838.1 unnamed protein product [Albugo candida]
MSNGFSSVMLQIAIIFGFFGEPECERTFLILTSTERDQATNVGLQLRESIRVPHITVEDLLGWKKRNSRSYFSPWLYYTIEMLIFVNLNAAVLSPNC